MDIENLFLSQFDPRIKYEIIEFGKRLTKEKADVFIVMARKAACFINCLQEINLVTLDGFVTSERILDLDTNWLKGKRVIIIDDTIISGTTLFKTINKLKKAEVTDISVSVLTIDKDNFVPDLLLNEKNQRSYLLEPYLSLNHSECIKVCSDIVNAISIYPRPYDVDFPYFNKINISESDFKRFIQHTNWSVENATSFLQNRHDVFTYTFTPNISIRERFNEQIGFDISSFAMLKVRAYGVYKKKNKTSYRLRILPIVVLKPLKLENVDKLFNSIVNIKINDGFAQINTYTAKLRLIQYFLATKLAEIWIKSVSIFVNEKVEVMHDLFTLRLLFNKDIVNPFLKILSIETTPLLSNKVKLKVDDVMVDNPDFKPKHIINDDSVETIQLLLTEPFLRLYYEKEIKAWEIVKKFGKNVFIQKEYIQLVDRLEKGYSISFLTRLVQHLKNINPIKIVSSFLDKAIDIGIAVPIIVEDQENNIIYRAYRHGEDVPFGEREEKLLAIVINAFGESLGRKELQHIWIEKLSVLLIKIGIQNKFLNPIITNIPPRDTINSQKDHVNSVVSIKSYLYGPIATYKVFEVNESLETKPYLEPGQNDLWLTNILKEKKIIVKAKDSNLYQFNEFPGILLDEKLEGQAENIGLIFGELMKNKLIDSHDDLIKLTACVYPQENLQALAAEINIFTKKWGNINSYIDRNLRNREKHFELAESIRKTNVSFTAINSGQQKFFWFLEKAGQKLIDEIKLNIQPKYLKNIWAEYWSPNKDWSVASIEKDLYDCIINQGLWLISMNAYLRILDYCLRNTASMQDLTIKSKNQRLIFERHDEIKECYDKLLIFKDHRRTREIIPFVKSILDAGLNASESDYISNSRITLIKIKSLIFNSKLLLDDAELLVNKFGKIDIIQRYSHTLYIDIDEITFFNKKKIWHEILSFIDEYKQKLFVSGQINDIILQLPDDKNILKRGIWLAANGSISSTVLPILANNILHAFSSKIRIKCVLFSQLPEEYRIKTAGDNNSTIKYGNFWSQIALLKDDFVLDLLDQLSGNQLITINEDKEFLTSDFEKLSKNIKSQYSHKLNKPISTDGIISNTYVINKYQYMNNQKSNNADIGIITIVSQETRAVLKHMSVDPKDDIIRDGRSFYEGWAESAMNKTHKIALTQLLEAGNRSVIPAYNSIIKNYSPKLVVIVGIAGSISQDLELCDVVIANQVIYYENRKETPNKTNRRGDIFKLEAKLKQFVNKLFVIYDDPAIIDASEDSSKETFKIVQGPIGSGEAVIADSASEIKDWLVNVNSKTMALEMEAGGFLQAYYEDGLTENQPSLGVLVIRGISDHADVKKDDKWRKPASENAVRCLSEILKIIPEFE